MRKLIAIVLSAGMLFLGACADDPEPDVAVDDTAVGEQTQEVDDFDFDTLDANGDSYLDADEIAETADDIGAFDEWDEDSDSELDPDEITGNTFELWDADRNGKIGKDEWELSANLWYPTETDVVVYNDVDMDGDSKIDADEFAERFDFSVLGESWTVDTFDQTTFKNAYFELYDADEDGKVSESEWTSGLGVFGTPEDL